LLISIFLFLPGDPQKISMRWDGGGGWDEEEWDGGGNWLLLDDDAKDEFWWLRGFGVGDNG